MASETDAALLPAIVVTGASSGIGQAIARVAAREKPFLLLVGRAQSVLRRENGETFVAVRTAGGWRKAPVQIGLVTPQHVEIVAGLEQGIAILSQPGELE